MPVNSKKKPDNQQPLINSNVHSYNTMAFSPPSTSANVQPRHYAKTRAWLLNKEFSFGMKVIFMTGVVAAIPLILHLDKNFSGSNQKDAIFYVASTLDALYLILPVVYCLWYRYEKSLSADDELVPSTSRISMV